jgi:phenylacetate-coenzyme A ligase PaaK-like adenylate-forming protein
MGSLVFCLAQATTSSPHTIIDKKRRIDDSILNLQIKPVGRGFTLLKNEKQIFNIVSSADFLEAALRIFNYQYQNNMVYRQWVDLLGVDREQVSTLGQIPFLPIEFFKTHQVVTGSHEGIELEFISSGTTGTTPSRHLVKDPSLYEESFIRCFRLFYGEPAAYCVLALLPGYLERKQSSLVYMVNSLIKMSGHPDSGFYLKDLDDLKKKIDKLKVTNQKVLLIGVSYALLDLGEMGISLNENFTVMETGGMKGTRREMLKQELHAVLAASFGVQNIHSEYGMTELLSQAYSRGDGFFEHPPWMGFLTREIDDPFSYLEGRTGGLNVIDLANINSCSFIATQDLGRITNGKLELMGRFDNSDVRGCNLMLQ